MSCKPVYHLIKGPFNYIDGKRREPENPSSFIDVIEPATGDVLCKMGNSSHNDVNEAVKSSKRAFKVWSKLAPRERGRFLIAAANKIREDFDVLVNMEVIDTGKPIWEARVDIDGCADSIEYYGGIASTLKGDHIPLPGQNFAMVVHEPLGVCGGIGAWNYPFQIASWKSAPALAAGNTMIYKPSEFTPLTTVALAEIFTSVGIPNGVFNVVQGLGDVGEAICTHRDIAKISFTGSVPTGQKILKSCADGIKKVTLELGGKSPLIIFDDCNLVNAVKGALLGNFLSQGQVCSNCTRVYVQRKIYQTFVDELVRNVEKLVVGCPWDEKTRVAATIHQQQAERVLSYVEEAKKQGVKVLCGGERVTMPKPYQNGYFLSPCVMTDCKDDMKIVKEEVFGAVVCVLPFETEEEVIRRANDSNLGLAGAVFTNDLNRAHRVANQIQSGTVWINNYNIYPPELPCGGCKMSGFGRENGQAALNEYTQLKTIVVETNDIDCPLFTEK
ncbi:ALDH9A1 (predicted) [Pycnogonum litorale]